ncbi:Coenzyme Q-binding protein coq10a, mitochondrial [Coemansia sp. RSA 2399]|nr:Coenzyme Q-binding protein coq10a, mitochondrial [Coemansia sp. RSA 2399]KAJ1903928.1 Coenzyme Q-binding protein coq10a, mitochondrial [Coemansia sp. IMI 209127]
MSLPSFGVSLSQGQKYSDVQVFPYTKEQIFAVVADVDRYSEFVPMCMESRVFHGTRRTEQAVGAAAERETVQAELVAGYPPFRERYVSQVVLDKPWRITATATPNGGIFKHMKTVWEFAEARSGVSSASSGGLGRACTASKGTLVRFAIEYEFVSILHAQAARLVFEKMAKTNLAAYLGRCQKLYGK